jgi:2-amino-4-hydroxy-6-hydroxymethyldihydropteridine diphosphokinase
MVERSSLRKPLACRVRDVGHGERTYFLGLGSNLGDRRRNLLRARQRLEEAGVEVLKASSVFRTEPVDVADQPWFLNQVLKIGTSLAPQELLDLAKSIETRLKRVPTVAKGPRTIDIDILLAGDTVINTPKLTIPHPRLALRNFALVPLREIAPRAVHPVLRKTVLELAHDCPDRSAVVPAAKSRRFRNRGVTALL